MYKPQYPVIALGLKQPKIVKGELCVELLYADVMRTWDYSVLSRHPRIISCEYFAIRIKHTHTEQPGFECKGCETDARAAAGQPMMKYHVTLERDVQVPVFSRLGLTAAQRMALHAARLIVPREIVIVSLGPFAFKSLKAMHPELAAAKLIDIYAEHGK